MEEQQVTSIPPSVSWLFEVSFHSLIYETDNYTWRSCTVQMLINQGQTRLLHW